MHALLNWTETPRPERVAMLRQWAETDGLSSTEIAAKFFDTVSRNTIIGLCHREKIKLQGTAGRVVGVAKEFQEQPVLVPIRTRLPDIPNGPPLAGSTPTDLLDTTGCRWPVRGGFCNEAISERHYCTTHYRKSYVPTVPIRVTRKGKIVL